MKLLVTGGCGYIGSVTVRILQDAGHDVVVLDDLSHGHRYAISSTTKLIRAHVGDVASHVSKSDAFDAVVHLAGRISVAESMTHPEIYWDNNVVQTLALLDAMRDLGIKKIVCASTAAVYGNPVTTPIAETAQTKPTSTYGMTKLAVDMALSSESAAHGLAATSLRFFNVAGAYGELGERHPVESHLIPVILKAASTKAPVALFGTDYDTTDGSCVRDYVHVEDLARAILLSLERLTPRMHSIYNLGNGNGFSNREIIAAVEKVTGTQLEIDEKARREGDPATLVAASDRARDELGWLPKHANIESIIGDAWRCYKATQR